MNLSATGTSPTRLLKGRIYNLRKTRRNQDFFFTESDRAKMGATVIAAGLAGLGGIATGLSGMAMDTSEEADLLEFDLDDKPVQAWVWQSVFNEGEEVEVVAEQIQGRWRGYGIHRVSDGIVALHPHCSRGRFAHYKASLKWWAMVFFSLLAFCYVAMAMFAIADKNAQYEPVLIVSALGGLMAAAISGFIGLRISMKFMGFVRLAEGIFEAFGWRDVKNIDLPAITKKGKKPDDPAPLGVLYFRYSDIASDASKWRASGRNSG